ncbi:uncharacterized protein C22orf15 homolog isoform X2 [Rana temporaria]|uniref:uncharacterized protein C22orf15 homolog isoform X2 n=1 Tax=Rana temporaria TaxID=8407 RepID=UPI001AACE443|nr:uncharacterized protein C22orf15 homolog isoform X2 [Rana temporaria]
MFITVKYGADHQILLNPNCKMVNLSEVLREKCQCGSEVPIDLLDESGTLINLNDLEGSQEVATNHLKERQCYILVKIIQRLQKLSNPNVRDKMRNSNNKKLRASKETPFTSPTKPRAASQQKSRPT